MTSFGVAFRFFQSRDGALFATGIRAAVGSGLQSKAVKMAKGREERMKGEGERMKSDGSGLREGEWSRRLMVGN